MSDLTEVEALKDRIDRLQEQVETLSRELGRVVELIDRYGETFGNHLKGMIADQGLLSRRMDALERERFQ